MAAENVLQFLQKLATISYRLDALNDTLERLSAATSVRLDRLEEQEEQMVDVRERLARLETARDADRAQTQADLARFMAQVERAELRLTGLRTKPGEPPALPEQGG